MRSFRILYANEVRAEDGFRSTCATPLMGKLDSA
jgi:hypothetical protein